MNQSLHEVVEINKTVSLVSLGAIRQMSSAEIDERRMVKRCNP